MPLRGSRPLDGPAGVVDFNFRPAARCFLPQQTLSPSPSITADSFVCVQSFGFGKRVCFAGSEGSAAGVQPTRFNASSIGRFASRPTQLRSDKHQKKIETPQRRLKTSSGSIYLNPHTICSELSSVRISPSPPPPHFSDSALLQMTWFVAVR